MKRISVYSGMFLLVFGAVLGLTAFTPDDVSAGIPCPEWCIYELSCTSTTGPNCTDPAKPYYWMGVNGWCTTGEPHHFCGDVFKNCCSNPE